MRPAFEPGHRRINITRAVLTKQKSLPVWEAFFNETDKSVRIIGQSCHRQTSSRPQLSRQP